MLHTMWTLYKDFQPALDEQPDVAEYYRFRLVPEKNIPHAYKVEEHHGWFDDQNKKAIHDTKILHPEDTFTWQGGMKLINQQILYLAKSGFVHQLTFDPFAPRFYEHVELDPVQLQATQS